MKVDNKNIQIQHILISNPKQQEITLSTTVHNRLLCPLTRSMKQRRYAMAFFAIELLLFLVPLCHRFTPVLSSSSNSTLLLQDLLKEISAKQSWDFNDVKVSRLDLTRFRFRASQRSEFRIGLGSTHLSAVFSDEISPWKKIRKSRSDDLASVIDEARSLTVLNAFKSEGPFEFRVVGDDDSPSLLLPMNRTHTGFKRILVGEGITVEVRGAREVSAFQASDLVSTGKSRNVSAYEKTEFWTIRNPFCRLLSQVQVNGSASFIAYRTRNPKHFIETDRISKETIELLAEKCYDSNGYTKRDCPVDSLSLRISKIERVLKSYFREQLDGFVGLFRGKIIASAIVRFQLELERSNVAQETHIGWRTRQSVRRVWYDVFAIVEERSLKLLMVKKTKPPFIVDTALWSDLTNISLTQLPSLLAPSEALTLDVKW